ncbi:hypothetical protein HYY70_05535 [Candidatus Woesearchaeota archaeon]|nr:hypothetical protein [Candidatus Woesearchaeota archaeon]
MKKSMMGTIAVFAVILVMSITIFSAALAASQQAHDNSKACDHASDRGKEKANENSVLSGCDAVPPPVECPPDWIFIPPDTCIPPA